MVNLHAICFDADGVVVHPQLQFSRYLEKEHGITPQMTRSFFRGVFNDCLIGKSNLKVVLPPFLQDWGWQGSVDDFINLWLLKDHVVDDRLIQVIQSLRRSGMICCLTTSQENNRAEYMKRKMGFEDVFDHLFFSCEVGYQKPDHSYFHHIEKMLHLDPGSFLFWDDSWVNVEAARVCGWNAEPYTDFDAFEKTIKKYRIANDLFI